MNGSRSTYMRKGYLLTALAAAVLLAASSGTAYAQRTIGFVGSSGSVSETAFSERPAPWRIRSKFTVRASGLRSGAGTSSEDIDGESRRQCLQSTPDEDLWIAIVTRADPRHRTGGT